MATRTIGTDIKLTGEKEFNDGMKAMNSNLKTLRTDMAAVSAEYADNADSVEALTAKNKILQQSVDQQKAKVDALRQMYEKTVKASGENSAAADKWKQQLNQATVALHKETAALEKNQAALDEAKDEKQEYTAVTQRMKNAVDDAGDKIKQLIERAKDGSKHIPVLAEAMDVAKVGAKGLGAAANGAKATLKGVGTAAGGVAKGVGMISGAAAAGVAALGALATVGVGMMVSFAKESADAAKAAAEAGEALTPTEQQWLQFSNQLGNLDGAVASAKSALGGILLPLLGDLSQKGASLLNSFASDMTAAAGNTDEQGRIMSEYIVKAVEMIKEQLPEFIQLGKDLLSGLGEGLSESGPELLDMGIELIMDLLNEIIEYAPELAQAGIALVEKLIASLTEQGPELMTSAVGMVTDIVLGLAQAAPDLIPAAVQLITQLCLALVDASPALLEAGIELVFGIISGITSSFGDIIGAADQIINKVVEAFQNSDSKILQIGADVIHGIWNGISSATEWLYGLLTGWVDGVIGWIKDKLDIHSPSGVTENLIGYPMGQGVGVGWKKSMKEVNKMISDSIDTSFSIPELQVVPGSGVGRNYRTAAGKTVNLYITAKSITEADINMVIDVVNRKLGEAM